MQAYWHFATFRWVALFLNERFLETQKLLLMAEAKVPPL